jgi:asparagine synthase (glutamine-hydrolysing)
MGHTRLAIIDASGGAQPRVDKASGDALMFNGEIYGYRALAAELRSLGVSPRDRSDTEVLFQLIRREGVQRAVERVDGMFAFAFRDGATDSLYLVRDRLGEKPLYYGLMAILSSRPKCRRCNAIRPLKMYCSIGAQPIVFCSSNTCPVQPQGGKT